MWSGKAAAWLSFETSDAAVHSRELPMHSQLLAAKSAFFASSWVASRA